MAPTRNEALDTSPREQDCHFTVFIRLPFPRAGFVDPPPIDWDSSKDRALWEILSRAPKGREVDWHSLADQFDVSLPFLLQQAAWLYERQLSQVRAQLRKVSKPGQSLDSSPASGSASGSAIAGGHAMKRGGSGGSRVPSALSNRARESPNFRSEGSAPSTPIQARRPQASRNSSTNTVHQTQKPSPSTAQQVPTDKPSTVIHTARSRETTRRSIDPPPKQRQQSTSRSAKAESSSSSSSSDSDTPATLSRSRAFTRRPRFSTAKAPLGPLSDADEDEDSPPFLPFSDPIAADPLPPTDSSATLRMALTKTSSGRAPAFSSAQGHPQPSLRTGHSSSSSTQSQSRNPRSLQNPLSPRRPGEPIHAISPRQRRMAKEGSEGTPSMGSSFSDLDDASVTQSALEEALANEMNHGSVASRMSTISQALRSRYL
ncbi:hypothetical protein MMC12_005228 [Toensbergia leucococca]|nr:hypothetical protein [Toensbergia leucococca]